MSDAQEAGCTCQRCGQTYRVDVLLSDELWRRVGRGQNLLCGLCIMERIEGLGEFAAFNLSAPAPARHTDRSIPCPTCGFVVRMVERRPFVIRDETEDQDAPQSSTIDNVPSCGTENDYRKAQRDEVVDTLLKHDKYVYESGAEIESLKTERDNALIQNDLAIRYWKGVVRSQDAAVLALREAGEWMQEALERVWEDWTIASDESDFDDYEIKDVAVSTVANVKNALSIAKALTSTATLAAEIEARIREEERERCAKLCDQQASFAYNNTRAGAYQHIAELLRGKPGAFTDETDTQSAAIRGPSDATPNTTCDHRHYDYEKHGRRCTCGVMMVDFGD